MKPIGEISRKQRTINSLFLESFIGHGKLKERTLGYWQPKRQLKSLYFIFKAMGSRWKILSKRIRQCKITLSFQTKAHVSTVHLFPVFFSFWTHRRIVLLCVSLKLTKLPCFEKMKYDSFFSGWKHLITTAWISNPIICHGDGRCLWSTLEVL